MDHKYTLTELEYTLLRRVTVLLILIVSSMVIIRLIEENYIQAFSDVMLSIVLVYSYSKSNRKDEKTFFFFARITFLFAFITLFILMIHTQEHRTLFVWFSTATYALFFLFGKREGWNWFLIIIATIIALYIYDKTLLGMSSKELIVWIGNMILILYIVNWYEKRREASTQELLNMQHILADEVKAKTFELQELNKNLQQKVEREVDKNREKEKQLLEQSRLAQMGEMISMIAHQWRQPLAAISATSATIELKASMNKLDSNDVQQKAHAISDYSQYLSKTIDDFRSFFKPNKEKEEVSFSIIATDVLAIVQPLLKNKSINIKTDFQDNTTINTYSSELKQVVLNLIKNAEDVLLEREVQNPEITIRTFTEDGNAILSVEDNGGGIDEAIVGKIFDPYFSTKKAKDGTGLGLYMSKTIVEEHCGGKLSVSNEEDGSVFRISLKGSV